MWIMHVFLLSGIIVCDSISENVYSYVPYGVYGVFSSLEIKVKIRLDENLYIRSMINYIFILLISLI